jgi:phospho-N-acetylmuramoyl-pentapeptide-transferase
MLYHILFPLHTKLIIFNVFRYITFRTVLAVLSALLISFFLTPYVIRKFNEWKIKSDRREDVPDRHQAKQGTPTMGGFVILVSTILPTLLIGFADDVTKLRGRNGKGISGRTKFLLQIMSSLIVSLLIYFQFGFNTELTIPFFKNATPDLGIFYILLCIFIIVGTSNGVNLTDGLDGLAIGPVLTVCSTFMLFAYLVGNVKFAQYLQIFYVYNAYPAELFMGDTGSLSLGASLATIAVIIKQEVLLVIAGGIFVMETASVIIQVLSFKWRGKRVFKMAPIHHHFELKGWNEGKIVVRFWIISIILALIALSTLKLR